jgi:hypothetical protein
MVKKTGNLEFAFELLIFFLVLSQGRIATTRKNGFSLSNAKFVLAFLTS